ncbi:translation initiation factor IF-2-like isoform X1 [Choloepus didactylus]|uniref:translation initiation factor IF-2-like isoform X1 n=1 Tax=Choloepus didactylus TaxID=27675 RepID=UPI0018A1076B|nr:translation initiation factor IF-2-like isoform X1 [Choloepus didactylus]
MNTAVTDSLPSEASTTLHCFLLIPDDSKGTVAYIPSPKWRKEKLFFTLAQGRKEGLRSIRRMPARLRAGGCLLTAAAREPGRRLSLRLRAASGNPGAPARVALRALAVSLRQVRGSRDADGGGGERRSPGTTPPSTLPPVTSRTTTSPNLSLPLRSPQPRDGSVRQPSRSDQRSPAPALACGTRPRRGLTPGAWTHRAATRRVGAEGPLPPRGPWGGRCRPGDWGPGGGGEPGRGSRDLC